jgi:hypothetical protein
MGFTPRVGRVTAGADDLALDLHQLGVKVALELVELAGPGPSGDGVILQELADRVEHPRVEVGAALAGGCDALGRAMRG